MPSKLILIGLVEEKDKAHEKAFKEWYLDNHVEDTYNCPKISAGTCYKLVRGFITEDVPKYLTIYEWEVDDDKQAEKILAEYQGNPKAWDKRMPNNNSMKIVYAGWYKKERAFPG